MREKALYAPVIRFLKNRGWQAFAEISPREGSPRIFDVVATKYRRAEALVVEAKLGSYRRALAQSQSRLFVADYVYVCFPMKYAKYVLLAHRDELEEAGIGVLGVGPNVRELLSADESRLVDPECRDELIEMTRR